MADETYSRKRAPITLSIDFETNERLKRYARLKHSTCSQVITDFIWGKMVTDELAAADETM